MRVHLVGGSADAPAGVILLHGLQGHWRETWAMPKATSSWPQWLADAEPAVSVWCVDYGASGTRWRGTSMPIRDRATSLLAALVAACGLGSRPFVLIGHSLGGLLVKQMVRHSSTMDDQYAGVCAEPAGVVFMSTPHTGSGLAAVASHLRAARATPLVRELVTDHAYLRELDDWYRNRVAKSGAAHLSFYEKQDTKGFRVVGEASGDPHLPGSTAIPVDADHRTVCKFAAPDDLTYLQLRQFVGRCLGPRTSTAAPDATRAPAAPAARLAPGTVPDRPVAAAGDSRFAPASRSAWSEPERMAEIAMAALLSEQLPSGGWARSLGRWMANYADASRRPAPSRPPMRVHGGIDVTCVALNRLAALAQDGTPELAAVVREPIAACAEFLRTCTPSGGAVGATIPIRIAPTEVRIRHTAITLATLIHLQRRLGETDPYPEVVRSARYLRESLKHWRQDTSGTFGMMVAAWNLMELLAHDGSPLGSHLTEEVQNLLATTVDEMAQEILRTATPDAGHSVAESCARFGAYGGLSALAQSSFLFGAKQLTSLRPMRSPSGLAQKTLFDEVVATCRMLATSVLDDADCDDGLLRVPTPEGPQPDLGLSVQALSVFHDLAAVATRPADEDLMRAAADSLAGAVEWALTSADDVLLRRHTIFTHGVQLAGLLDVPEIADVGVTDRQLHRRLKGVARRTLSRRDLVRWFEGGARHKYGALRDDELGAYRSFGRAWSQVLEGGHYRDVDPPLRDGDTTMPWRLGPSTVDALVALRRRTAETDRHELWIHGSAERDAGVLAQPRANERLLAYTEWVGGSQQPGGVGVAWLYLPTVVSSGSPDELLEAFRRARAALHGSDGQGVVCLRFGDHRIVAESGERVLFLDGAESLERALHTTGLKLVGLDVCDDSPDGTEVIAKFGLRTRR